MGGGGAVGGDGDGGVVRVEGRAGRGEGRGGVSVVDAVHVLVGGHGAGDLDELNSEEHGHPGELEGDPDGEEEGVGVRVNDAAERWGDEVAGGGSDGREGGVVWRC